MSRVSGGRLGVAVSVAAAVVLSSPFIGDLRAAIRSAAPSRFPIVVTTGVATAVVVALIIAIARIRENRTWRFAGVVAAVGGAAVYARMVATGNLEVDVVEHVHFVEYGVIAWLFYRAFRPLDNGLSLTWPVLAGMLVGIADESLQWFTPARVGEVHDIFLNGVSVICGLTFAVSVDPPSQARLPLTRATIRPLAYGVTLVVVAFALFFQAVHLGHQIYAPGVGVFWSRYTQDDLLAASVDRTRRWRSSPPRQMRRLSREDQYLSEGLWHVQERNRAWTAEDPFTAWRENRILEMFFAPVLDTSSYASNMRPRWPQEQRENTASRVGDDPGIYISRAAPYPIYAWNPWMLWAAVALIVAGILTAC